MLPIWLLKGGGEGKEGGEGEEVLPSTATRRSLNMFAACTGRTSVVHLVIQGTPTALPDYSCIGIAPAPGPSSCNSFALAYFPDGDVWSYGRHAKYEGSWPNPFGYKVIWPHHLPRYLLINPPPPPQQTNVIR